MRVRRFSRVFPGVVTDSIRFCFEIVAGGTGLEGARLDIDEPPGRAYCRDCRREFALDDPIMLCDCGSADLDILAGREPSPGRAGSAPSARAPGTS